MLTYTERLRALIEEMQADHPEMSPADVRRVVERALNSILPSRRKGNGRDKEWSISLRFWDLEGPTLLAETDAELIISTGAIADRVRHYAEELHGEPVPLLTVTAKQLQALRVNLAARHTAVLRLEYSLYQKDYLCQCEVVRIG